MEVTRVFYESYYSDEQPRTLMLGINPGRFGGGVTGVPFTDPIRLETACGIANSFEKRAELSSKFIYEMIQAYGGPHAFYRRFYISAVSPLGFVRNGKNLNYYDIPEYPALFEEYVIQCLKVQLDFPLNREVVYCIGQGKNVQYLGRLNAEHGFFKSIRTVPHPRWVMQYRLAQKDTFIEQYLGELNV